MKAHSARRWAVAGVVVIALVGAVVSPSSAAPTGGKRAPAKLQLSANKRSFGSVPLGSSSTPFTFTVSNVGGTSTGPVAFGTSGTNAADFVAVPGTTGGCVSGTTALAAGATCTIKVTFAPSGATGAKSATLRVADGPGAGSPSATLTGTGTAPASLAMSPATHDFGQVPLGRGTFATTFTVRNAGQATSSPVSFSLTGADPSSFVIVPAAANGCVSGTTTLTVGASCTIDVAFQPPYPDDTLGMRHATLQATTSNSYEGIASAALTGEATDPDLLQISPTSKDFGTVAPGSSSSATFTVTNVGNVTSDAIGLHTGLSGGSADEFSIPGLTDLCTGTVLDVDESCTFVVRFAPTTNGTKSATVSTWTTRTPNDFSATLTGEGGTAAGCTATETSGCITLDDVVLQLLTSAPGADPPTYGTDAYTLSGSLEFHPLCTAGADGCDYPWPAWGITGSGTFSLDDGATNVDSGTWTADYYDGTHPPSYHDGVSAFTTCADAAIRVWYVRIFFTGSSGSWQTNYLQIRTDTTASGPFKNMVVANFASPPVAGNLHTSDMSGVTITC